MRAAGQLRNGSPPTSTTPPNNLAPHDSLFLGSAGRWPVAFGSLPNALIAAHNSVQNTSQGFAASCRELQASGLRSPERPGGVLRKNHLCRTADVLPLVLSCRHRYEKGVRHDRLFAERPDPTPAFAVSASRRPEARTALRLTLARNTSWLNQTSIRFAARVTPV